MPSDSDFGDPNLWQPKLPTEHVASHGTRQATSRATATHAMTPTTVLPPSTHTRRSRMGRSCASGRASGGKTTTGSGTRADASPMTRRKGSGDDTHDQRIRVGRDRQVWRGARQKGPR